MRRVIQFVLILVAAGAFACEQRPPETDSASTDTTADTTAETAANTTAELSPPAQDCDYKPPVTFGQTCEESAGVTVPGSCDPVEQTGCAREEHCRFAVQLNESGNPDSFVRVCSELVCGSRTQMPGQKCEPNQCMPGSLCVSGICKRYCRLGDAKGCAPDEFCVAAQLNPEFGYCEASCNP